MRINNSQIIKENLFEDFPHTIKILNKEDNFIFKSVSNKKIQKREYSIQKFLESTNLVPKVQGYSHRGFFEKVAPGKQLNKLNKLSDLQIINIARGLKEIHSLKLTPFIKTILKRELNKNGIYEPLTVYKLLIKGNARMLKDFFCEKELVSFINNLSLDLGKTKFTLVHGDLSVNNIFVNKNQVTFIDWTDCRYDLPSCDISQFFYLCKIQKKQGRLFLKEYDSDWVTDDLLKLHKLFLLLYDFIKAVNLNSDYSVFQKEINNLLISQNE